MKHSHGPIVLVVAVLSGCAGTPETGRDRYGLAAQKDVYLIKRPVEVTFAVHQHGKSIWVPFGQERRLIEKHMSAGLQEKLGLEDPVHVLADRLAVLLRRDLGLTNLRVVAEPSSLPVVARERPNTTQSANIPWNASAPPAGPSTQTQPDAERVATFRDSYPSGLAIQVVTREWGLENYKMRYYATVRMFDLAASKVVMAKNCPVVMFEQVDRSELARATGTDQFGRYDPGLVHSIDLAIEEKVFADNGAMIKTNLRKAAELCADNMAPAFVGKG